MRVEVQHLVKEFGDVFSLDIPSLSIEPGQTFGLVGNNGAGKTTFLRILLDLLLPDSGTLRIHGWDTSKNDEWKSFVGSYLDSSFLIDYLTPLEFHSFVGSVYGLNEDQTMENLRPYLSFLPPEATSNSTKYIRDLSTGNAKKVGIVAAMFIQPNVLVLDEPFANLDPRSQIALKSLLQQLNQQHGTTLFISSHDLAHVTEICERIAVLENGRIVREIQTSDETLRELELYFAEG